MCKIVFNKLIPFKGFFAINLFGIIFVREEYRDRQYSRYWQNMITHESIHTAQMKEMLYVFFYLWYLIEWVIRLIKGQPYEAISFEREAYQHDVDNGYLEKRKHFSWFKYL